VKRDNEILAKFLIYAIALQLVFGGILIGSNIAVNYYLKSELSREYASQIRSAVLVSDWRTVARVLSAAGGSRYDSVAFYHANGHERLSYPPTMNLPDEAIFTKSLNKRVSVIQRELFYDSERTHKLGTVYFQIDPFDILNISLLAWAIVALFTLLFSQLMFKRFKAAKEEEVKLERLTAIASATQMVAHDVRKPFHQLKLVLDELNPSTDVSKLGVIKEHINQSLKNVNEIIADIIEIGSPPKFSAKEQSVKGLIMNSLKRCLSDEALDEMEIKVEIESRYSAIFDCGKVERVLVNLIQNGIEANGGRGHLWVKAVDLAMKKFVRIEVGNDGSFIPKDMKASVFHSFFTTGKDHGTGLGLAIARKIVNDHGGEIWLESDKQKGTVFYLTLPRSDLPEEHTGFSLIKIIKRVDGLTVDTLAVQERSVQAREPLAVFVDDDPFILDFYKKFFKGKNILLFSRPSDFFDYAAENPWIWSYIKFFVTDYFFGHSYQINGATFARQLRQHNARFPIYCLSDMDPASNEDVKKDFDDWMGKDECSLALLVREFEAVQDSAVPAINPDDAF